MAAKKTKLKNATQRKVHTQAYRKGYSAGYKNGFEKGQRTEIANVRGTEVEVEELPPIHVNDEEILKGAGFLGRAQFTNNLNDAQNVAIKELTDRITALSGQLYTIGQKPRIIVNVNAENVEVG